jgi:hypothetical protein
MKKDERTPETDDLRPEHDRSDLRGGVCGKYLGRYRKGRDLTFS